MYFALAIVATTCRVFSQLVTSSITRMIVSSQPRNKVKSCLTLPTDLICKSLNYRLEPETRTKLILFILILTLHMYSPNKRNMAFVCCGKEFFEKFHNCSHTPLPTS